MTRGFWTREAQRWALLPFDGESHWQLTLRRIVGIWGGVVVVVVLRVLVS